MIMENQMLTLVKLVACERFTEKVTLYYSVIKIWLKLFNMYIAHLQI